MKKESVNDSTTVSLSSPPSGRPNPPVALDFSDILCNRVGGYAYKNINFRQVQNGWIVDISGKTFVAKDLESAWEIVKSIESV